MKKTLLALLSLAICSTAQAGLTAGERLVLDRLMQDDVEGTLDGNISMIFRRAASPDDPIFVEMDDMEREFRDNEFKANKTYKGKKVVVSGHVNGVQVDLSDKVILYLHSAQSLITPSAEFADVEKQADAIAELSKGQRVHLMCKVRGFSVGAVRMKNCYTSAYLVEKAKRELDQYLQDLEAGNKPKDEMFGVMVAYSVMIYEVATPEERKLLEDPATPIEKFTEVARKIDPEAPDFKARIKKRMEELGLKSED